MPIFNTVYKYTPTIEYSIDFRNNSQASIEAEGWSFTGRNSVSYSFSSSGLTVSNSGGQIMVSRSLDTTKFKRMILTGYGYLANKGGQWDGGEAIKVGQVTPDFNDGIFAQVIGKISRNVASGYAGVGIEYDGTGHYTGTALSAGDYTWTFTIDLSTGVMTNVCSDGQTISGTMNSTYLGYVKSASTQIGIFIDSNSHILHTFKMVLEY